MNVGTKSLLFGVHQFLWHPIVVLLAWYRLFGRPTLKDLVCIIVHDWGYMGSPEMDGSVGTLHPLRSAKFVRWLGKDAEDMVKYHSRRLANELGEEPSKLCLADKLSFVYEIPCFYLFRARITGELAEYRRSSERAGFCPLETSDIEWFHALSRRLEDIATCGKSELSPY